MRTISAQTIAGDARASLSFAGPALVVQVTVRYATDALQLEISDDRRTTLASESDSDLLAALRERAAVYSGHIEAGRRADGDYAVHARLPLRSSP